MAKSCLLAGAPVLVSDEYDMWDLVSILRQATLLVSSRFHAMVSTIPARSALIGRADGLIRSTAWASIVADLILSRLGHATKSDFNRQRAERCDARRLRSSWASMACR